MTHIRNCAWTKEFISLLRKSTITTPLTEPALDLKESHLPRYLYKYRRHDSYSLSNLRDDTVWICSPEQYNDPYDSAFKISDDEVIRAAKRGLFSQFVRIYKLKNILSPEAIRLARQSGDPFQQLIASIPDDVNFPPGSHPVQGAQFASLQLPTTIRDTISVIHQMRSVTKVCSFTERNDSIVMWSHYSDNHEGFCIEYDISKLPPQSLLRRSVFPVVYCTRIFDLTQWSKKLVSKGRHRLNPAMVLLAMMHKYKDWGYEQEWRLILTEPRMTPDRAITVPRPSRLFLGSRIPSDKKATLLDICAAKGIEAWQMKKEPSAFELTVAQVS